MEAARHDGGVDSVDGVDEVGRYLGDLIGLVAQATPGPLRVARESDRHYALTTGAGRRVAVVNRRSDAALFARDRMDLRALVLGVSEVMGLHHDRGDGRCVQDGQPMPCATLRELRAQLAPRAESVHAESVHADSVHASSVHDAESE
jgi:hypothetical protein